MRQSNRVTGEGVTLDAHWTPMALDAQWNVVTPESVRSTLQ
jgi:hypothetical protein